jgi:hypothetical protein
MQILKRILVQYPAMWQQKVNFQSCPSKSKTSVYKAVKDASSKINYLKIYTFLGGRILR